MTQMYLYLIIKGVSYPLNYRSDFQNGDNSTTASTGLKMIFDISFNKNYQKILKFSFI